MVNGQPEPVIITMKSSQIKKSRAWMTRMQNLTMARKDGTRFKAPMFSHVWTLTTKQETNDRGSWFGYFIEGKQAIDFSKMAMQVDSKISGDRTSSDTGNSQF